ncbi:response regulator [Flavitalea antarctica]
MKHILLIEDDLDDQEIFLTALGNLEVLIACETAISAAEALERLKSDEIKPDLIFLDLKMSGMHGFQFMNQLKLQPAFREIPVIILSDSSDPLDIEMAKIAGAKRFITKPEDAAELEKAIKESVQAFSR